MVMVPTRLQNHKPSKPKLLKRSDRPILRVSQASVIKVKLDRLSISVTEYRPRTRLLSQSTRQLNRNLLDVQQTSRQKQ